MDFNEQLRQTESPTDTTMVTMSGELKQEFPDDVQGPGLLASVPPPQDSPMTQESSTPNNSASVLSARKNSKRCPACQKCFSNAGDGPYGLARSACTIPKSMSLSTIKQVFPNLTTEGHICYICRRKLYIYAVENRSKRKSALMKKSTKTKDKLLTDSQPQTVRTEPQIKKYIYKSRCCACNELFKKRRNGHGKLVRYNMTCASVAAIKRTFRSVTTDKGFLCLICRKKLLANTMPHELIKRRSSKKQPKCTISTSTKDAPPATTQRSADHPEAMLTEVKEEFSDDAKGDNLLPSSMPHERLPRSPESAMYPESCTSPSSPTSMLSVSEPEVTTDNTSCRACNMKFKIHLYGNGIFQRYQMTACASQSAIKRTFPHLTTDEGYICLKCRRKLLANAMPHEMRKTQVLQKKQPRRSRSPSSNKALKSQTQPETELETSSKLLKKTVARTTLHSLDLSAALLMEVKDECLEDKKGDNVLVSSTPTQQTPARTGSQNKAAMAQQSPGNPDGTLKNVKEKCSANETQSGTEMKMTPKLLNRKNTATSQAVTSKRTSVLKPQKFITKSMKSAPVSGPCAEFGHALEIQLPFELIDLMKESPNPSHFYGKNGDDRLLIVGNKLHDGKSLKLFITGPRDFKERTDTISCCVTDLICLSPRQDECQEDMDQTMPKCETKLDPQIEVAESMSESHPGPSITKKLKLAKTESTPKKSDLLCTDSSEKENEEAIKNIQFEVVTAEEEKENELLQQSPNEFTEIASPLDSRHDRKELEEAPACPVEVAFNATQPLTTISEFTLSEELGLSSSTELFSTSTSAAYDELSSIPNITWSEMNNAGEITVEVCTQSYEVNADTNDSAVTVGLCQNDGSLLILGPDECANPYFTKSAPAQYQKNADDSDKDFVDDVDADPDWETAEQPPKASRGRPRKIKSIHEGHEQNEIAGDGKLFHCKLCSYTAGYKSTFKCHLHTNHKMSVTEYRQMFNYPVICKRDAEYSKDLTDESREYMAAPDEYRYRCKLCVYSNVERELFKGHLRNRHKLSFEAYKAQFGDASGFPCTASGDAHKAYNVPSGVTNATGSRDTPKQDKSCLCELCGRSVKTLPGLISHLKGVHKNESGDIINRIRSERTAKLHQKAVGLKRCPFCEEKFLKADIMNHVMREHQDCENFDILTEILKKAVTKAGYGQEKKAKHKTSGKRKNPTAKSKTPTAKTKTPTVESKTECPMCTYASTDPEDVYQHKLMIHSNWRKFDCPSCGASFNTSLALKKHIKWKHPTNSNAPPNKNKCPLCQKVFASLHKCHKHMLMHQRRTAEGLTCHICQKSCTRPEKLVRHMKKVHGQTRKVMCKLCGCSVQTTDELVGHKCPQKSKPTDKAATRTTADVSQTLKRVEETERTEDITAKEKMDVTLEYEDIKDNTCGSIPISDNVLISECSTPAPSTSDTSQSKTVTINGDDISIIVENLFDVEVGHSSGDEDGTLNDSVCTVSADEENYIIYPNV